MSVQLDEHFKLFSPEREEPPLQDASTADSLSSSDNFSAESDQEPLERRKLHRHHSGADSAARTPGKDAREERRSIESERGNLPGGTRTREMAQTSWRAGEERTRDTASLQRGHAFDQQADRGGGERDTHGKRREIRQKPTEDAKRKDCIIAIVPARQTGVQRKEEEREKGKEVGGIAKNKKRQSLICAGKRGFAVVEILDDADWPQDKKHLDILTL